MERRGGAGAAVREPRGGAGAAVREQRGGAGAAVRGTLHTNDKKRSAVNCAQQHW